MVYWVVYDYGWYNEPYGSFLSLEDAERNLFLAKRARPNTKVKILEQKIDLYKFGSKKDE